MSTEYTRLLMYFILVMGVILIGVLLVSFVELQKGNTKLEDASIKLNQTQATLNQTQATINQTKLFIESTKHEDESRANQTRHENEARDVQRDQIIKETNKSIDNLERNLSEFILQSENRSQTAGFERDQVLAEILKLQSDNRETQFQLNNVTNQILDVLNQYREQNLTEIIIENNNLLKNQISPPQK